MFFFIVIQPYRYFKNDTDANTCAWCSECRCQWCPIPAGTVCGMSGSCRVPVAKSKSKIITQAWARVCSNCVLFFSVGLISRQTTCSQRATITSLENVIRIPGGKAWCWRHAARRGEAGRGGEGLQALLGLHTYLGVCWIRRQQDVVARYDDVAETLIELGTVDGQVVVLEPCATFGQSQTDVFLLVFWQLYVP